MREIKFRGKSLKYGNWLYGSLWLGGDNAYIIHERPVEKAGEMMWHDTYVTEVDLETIGQYTGLKDANGKEIYEGDIVSILSWKGVVVYNNEYASFNVRCERSNIDIKNFFVYGGKIIGNIHDKNLIK